MSNIGLYREAMASLDDDVDSAVKDMADLSNRLLRKIQKLLLQLDTQPGSDKLETTKAALSNAYRVRDQVVRAIEEEGYGAFRSAGVLNAEKAAQNYLKGFELGDFQPDYIKVTNKLLGTVDADARRAWGESADNVRMAVNARVNGANAIGDLLDDIGDATAYGRSKSQTLVGTLVDGVASQALRESLEESGQAGTLRYQYIGARADGIIRPFCARHLNKIMTIEEIDKLNNGQGLDCFVHGGGYNCRHRWIPLFEYETEAG